MPIQQALLHEPPAATTVVGQQEYTSPGSYSWTCPSEVNEVHVVCIGGGGGGGSNNYEAGGGGALGWKNNIPVTPGQSYTVVVGNGGSGNTSGGTDGGDSYFINTSTVKGGGGKGNNQGGGTYTGDGGGNGGDHIVYGGGGGAGGYSANGNSNSGGSGGGGAANGLTGGGAGGGGVGIYGEGSSGQNYQGGTGNVTSYGAVMYGGGGGSGGNNGANGVAPTFSGGYYGLSAGMPGGNYGGGGGGGASNWGSNGGNQGGQGAVRIIWGVVNGVTRAFPSTLTSNQNSSSTYALNAPNSVDEGSSFTTTVTTGNVSDGTTLYWRLTGIDSSDLTSGSLTGTGTISSGGFSFSHTLAADISTEGEEVIYIALYTDAGYTTLVSAANVVVNDTSFDPVGESIYTEEGSFSWVCPANVTSVSVVCVGSGSTSVTSNNGNEGCSGGGLGYINNYSVTPGQSYAVQVGGPNGANNAPWVSGTGSTYYEGPADSFFVNRTTVKGGGGWTNSNGYGGFSVPAGNFVGDGGGNGGGAGSRYGGSQYSSGDGGGGGAGGYSGDGGAGGRAGWAYYQYAGLAGSPGTGGAGGGGGGGGGNAGPGGGVGIYGEGGNGEGGVRYGGGPGGYGPGKGGGGSKDPYGDGGHGSSIGGQAIQNGGDIFSYPGDSQRRVAGNYGAGGTPKTRSARGAVRIMWGTGRSFPNNALAEATNRAETQVTGGQQFTTAGTFTWTCPVGVTSISAVAIGGGGGGQSSGNYQGTPGFEGQGGGGGALVYKNYIPVVEGQDYEVVVGAGGAAANGVGNQNAGQTVAQRGGDTTFGINGVNILLHAEGGAGGVKSQTISLRMGGRPMTGIGYSGGDGGQATGSSAGGGAGGYSGEGGDGGFGSTPTSGINGTGGAAGGGGGSMYAGSGGGGGTGLNGEGSSGAGGTGVTGGVPDTGEGGGGGSGGNAGSDGAKYSSNNGQGGSGGSPGGGGGGGYSNPGGGNGTGAVGGLRIIWGSGRTFPSNAT